MTKLQKIKEIIKQDKKQLEVNYKVKKIGIFGSYIRGKSNSKSDLDILLNLLNQLVYSNLWIWKIICKKSFKLK